MKMAIRIQVRAHHTMLSIFINIISHPSSEVSKKKSNIISLSRVEELKNNVDYMHVHNKCV